MIVTYYQHHLGIIHQQLTDKVKWVQKYIPNGYKRLILSHNKNLNIGDYLIDDRTACDGEFDGRLLKYGNEKHSSETLRKYFNI